MARSQCASEKSEQSMNTRRFQPQRTALRDAGKTGSRKRRRWMSATGKRITLAWWVMANNLLSPRAAAWHTRAWCLPKLNTWAYGCGIAPCMRWLPAHRFLTGAKPTARPCWPINCPTACAGRHLRRRRGQRDQATPSRRGSPSRPSWPGLP